MINLLPPSYRQAIKTHRLHKLAGKWLVLICVSTGLLLVILAAGWFYIHKQSNDLKKSLANTQQELAAENLSQVQKDTKTLTTNIKTVNLVLSREIRFSDLLQDIGKVMPSGTVLNSLTLSQASGAIDLSASAKDYASAAQIAVNLSDPGNKIFAKVDINNISCTPPSSTDSYPCTGAYRALFSKTTQARYIGFTQEGQ